MYAVVDEEDYERVKHLRWMLTKKGYVTYRPDMHTHVMLHNLVMNVPNSSGVDHIDRDKLNNQKHNLRITTNSIQGQNRGRFKNNSTGFRGVSYHKGHNKFQASIKFNYQAIHIGYFETKEEAARAYDKMAITLFGITAEVNFPQEVRVSV